MSKPTSDKTDNKFNSKSSTLISNFFEKSTNQTFQLILIKLLVDEDAPKDLKKKIEEFKLLEKTVNGHNEFLLFLANKKSSYYTEIQNTPLDVQTKLNAIQSKLEFIVKKSELKELV